MPLAVTQTTHLRLASATLAILLTSFSMYLRRSYPLTASLGRAVYSVFCGVFRVLLVPHHLELRVKQVVDMFERDVVRGTAFRWHMLWVVH